MSASRAACRLRPAALSLLALAFAWSSAVVSVGALAAEAAAAPRVADSSALARYVYRHLVARALARCEERFAQGAASWREDLALHDRREAAHLRRGAALALAKLRSAPGAWRERMQRQWFSVSNLMENDDATACQRLANDLAGRRSERVKRVRIDELRAFLAQHPKVVVQFTSQDSACLYCLGQSTLFDALASFSPDDVTLARVTWEPLLPFPKLDMAWQPDAVPKLAYFRDGGFVHDGSFVNHAEAIRAYLSQSSRSDVAPWPLQSTLPEALRIPPPAQRSPAGLSAHPSVVALLADQLTREGGGFGFCEPRQVDVREERLELGDAAWSSVDSAMADPVLLDAWLDHARQDWVLNLPLAPWSAPRQPCDRAGRADQVQARRGLWRSVQEDVLSAEMQRCACAQDEADAARKTAFRRWRERHALELEEGRRVRSSEASGAVSEVPASVFVLGHMRATLGIQGDDSITRCAGLDRYLAK